MQINLTNQEIVKFAYITKEIIDYVWGAKLTNAQANCYEECFYTVKDLLEDVDKEYLKKHKELCKFFLTGKRLNNKDHMLQWEKKWKSAAIQPKAKPQKQPKKK